MTGLGGGERTVGCHYVESVLPVDAPVYVLGVVQRDGGIGVPAGDGGRFEIGHRSEEQLQRKYRRDALTLGLIAAGPFLFGFAFVAVGVLVDADRPKIRQSWSARELAMLGRSRVGEQ